MVDEGTLESYFSKFGEIASCEVMRERETLRSRGFAFLTFRSASSAEACLREQPHSVGGRHVDVNPAVPRDGGDMASPPAPTRAMPDSSSLDPNKYGGTCKMFIGGLAQSVDNDVFREFFQAFGEVRDAIVMMDRWVLLAFLFFSFLFVVLDWQKLTRPPVYRNAS